jgi:hypothetical protein
MVFGFLLLLSKEKRRTTLKTPFTKAYTVKLNKGKIVNHMLQKKEYCR